MEVVWLPARGLQAIAHFATELPRARLLFAGIGLGIATSLFSTLVLGDSFALLRSLTNYALLAVYGLVIYLATDRPPDMPRLRWSRPQLLVWLLIATGLGAWTLGYEVPWVDDAVTSWVLRMLQTWTGLAPDRAETESAVARILYLLLLPGLVFSLLGQKPRDLGLKPRKLALGLLLLVGGLLLRLVGFPEAASPLPDSLVGGISTFSVLLVIRALPVEFFYRALLLPRLEARLTNPLDAIALSAFLYSLAQVPAAWSAGTPVPALVIDLLGGLGNAPAIASAYLYIRTRSVWPGAVWWAGQLILGPAFG